MLGVGVLEESLYKLSVLPDEVECSEKTLDAALSEAVVSLKKLNHALLKDFLHLLDMAYDILVNHVLHCLVSSNAADGVSLVSGAPSERVRPVEILDRLAETYSGKG
jgi:hypothetical protein